MAEVVVTFDARGGSVSPERKTVTVGNQYGSLPIPVKAGNSFGGWFDSVSRGNEIKDSTVVTIENDHYLYAKWIPDRVTVSFNVPSGSIVVPQSKIVEKTRPYGWLPTPTRDGWEFQNWTTASGAIINSESIVPVDNPPTILYSTWLRAKCIIHFVVGDGFTLLPNERDVTYRQLEPLVELSPSIYRTTPQFVWRYWGSRILIGGSYHYGEVSYASAARLAFLGWWTTPSTNDSGYQVTEDMTCPAQSELTLYARWDFSKLKQTVTFHTGDGSEFTKDYFLFDWITPFKYARLPVPSKQNNLFLGWYDRPDNRMVIGTSYNPEYFFPDFTNGELVSPNDPYVSNKVLYTNSSYCIPGVSDPPSATDLVTIAQVGGRGPNDLYAWFSSRYIVTLDTTCRLGDISVISAVVATYGEKLPHIYGTRQVEVWDEEELIYKPVIINTYAPMAPEKSGYTFQGFYEFPNGQGKRYYKPVSEYNEEADITTIYCVGDEPYDHFGDMTIYAHWTQDNPPPPPPTGTVKITFDNSDYPLTFTTKRYSIGKKFKELPMVVDGFADIDSWYVGSGRDAVFFDKDTICNFQPDSSVVAHPGTVSYNIYRITYEKNGGSATTSPTSYRYQTQRATQINVYATAKTGYTYGGLYDSPMFEGDPITEIPIKTYGDKILYLKWIPNSYTVTLNPNGGSVSPSSVSVKYKEQYGNLPVPTKANKVFAGWFTSASGGTEVLPDTIYSSTSNSTLYAHWNDAPEPIDHGKADFYYKPQ